MKRLSFSELGLMVAISNSLLDWEATKPQVSAKRIASATERGMVYRADGAHFVPVQGRMPCGAPLL
jgi:hypothetical protein